jgi:ABC-type maltose transport system permease subunit
LNVDNFVIALTQTDFLVNLRNSVIVVFSAVIFAIVIGFWPRRRSPRFRFRGRRSIMISLLAAQMLPGAALLVPLFLIFNEAGLTGTYAGLILVHRARPALRDLDHARVLPRHPGRDRGGGADRRRFDLADPAIGAALLVLPG